jgi:hypothetical protein
MEITYALCEFEYGYAGTFYQESGGGNVLRFLNTLGQEINLIAPYGYRVIDGDPTLPQWAIKNINNALNNLI